MATPAHSAISPPCSPLTRRSDLSSRYNLPKDAIASGLPLIGTSKTIIGPYCPAFLNGYDQCEVTRYRTINGMCNNLEFPHWGSARNTFRRLLAPNYADGEPAARTATRGADSSHKRRAVRGGLYPLNHDKAIDSFLRLPSHLNGKS